MTATYEKIQTYTLGSTAATFSFTSIPSTYTDLVIIVNSIATSQFNIRTTFNSDTGGNYGYTYLVGGAGRESGRSSNSVSIDSGTITTARSQTTIQIHNYVNSTNYKTMMALTNSGEDAVIGSFVGHWRNTAAITTVTLTTTASTWAVGSMATLYGIKREV